MSLNTVASHIIDLPSNSYRLQLHKILKTFPSYLMKEVIKGIAYCAVFIRRVDKKFNITEELFDLLPLKGTVTR